MPDTPARPLWTAAEIAAATGGVLHGDDRPVTGLTYNSREIVPGDLFLALKGARDGHEFAASAFAAGAAAALVERPADGGPYVVGWRPWASPPANVRPRSSAAPSPAASARPA